MTTIAKLTAYLLADSADFESGMKKAAKAAQDFQKTTSAAAEGAAISFVSVGAALAALSIHQASTIDASLKVAESLGVGLSEFDAMARVAKDAGISQEDFAKDLTNTQKALYAAAGGAKQQQYAFRALGLDINALLKLTPDKQFEAIADALGKVQNPTERTALATQLYGRAGRDVINMLVDYKAKLDDARAFNDKFNLSLNEIDAKKVEEARVTMSSVKDAASGLGNTIAVKLSPLVTEFGKDLLDAGVDGKTFGASIDDGLATAGTAIDVVRQGVLGMKAIFADISLGIDLMTLNATKNIYDIAKAAESLPGIGNAMKEVAQSMLNLNQGAQLSGQQDLKTIADLNKEAGDFKTTAQKIAEIQDAVAKRAADAAKKGSGLYGPPAPVNDGGKSVDQAISRQKELLKSIVGPALELKQTMADLSTLLASKKITVDQYNDALAKLKLQMAELDKTENGGFAAGLLKIQAQMKDVGNVAESTLVSSFDQVNGTALRLQVQLDALNILMAKNPQYARQYADEIDKTKIAMAEFSKTADGGVTAALLRIKQQSDDTGKTLEDSIVSSWDDAVGKGQKLNATVEALGILMKEDSAHATQYGEAMLQANIALAQLDHTASGGFKLGMLQVEQELNNVSDIAAKTVTDAFGKAEDALDQFVQTGKLNFKDLVNSIEEDLIRLALKEEEQKLFSSLGSGGSGGGLLGSIGGFLSGLNLPSFAVGSDYVPHDMIAQIHKGERIVPAAQNMRSSGGDVYFSIDARGASPGVEQAIIAGIKEAQGGNFRHSKTQMQARDFNAGRVSAARFS